MALVLGLLAMTPPHTGSSFLDGLLGAGASVLLVVAIIVGALSPVWAVLIIVWLIRRAFGGGSGGGGGHICGGTRQVVRYNDVPMPCPACT